MLELIKRAERSYPSSNVMLVCASEDLSHELLELISKHDLNLVGAAHNAGTALALAATVSAEVALIHPMLSGRRDGHELSRRLEEDWGVHCLMIEPSAQA